MSADRFFASCSAANRFGLGARPGDLDKLTDPAAWLLRQTAAAPLETQVFTGLPGSYDYLRQEAEFLARRKQLKGEAAASKDRDPGSPKDPLRKLYLESFGEDLRREYLARWQIAAQSDTPFAERLVRFWSNHFAVSTDKIPAALYAAPLEREAIRPHVNGRFVDLLLAVEAHPAMLRYLDQAQSIGPHSRAARFLEMREFFTEAGEPQRKFGLNENLAREILELHTLGADSGYSQDDVTEFARALTGWSMPAPRQIERGMSFDSAFLYRSNAHEPGSRSILGKSYPEDGQDQARAVLADLAVHPATAQHLALKLARHFVADQPPPALVQRMVRAYLDSHGQLPALYAAMVQAPESWAPAARKFRTPQDFVVAGIRGGAVAIGERPRPWEGVLVRLGQPTFQPRSPAGYTDIAADWIAADAIWKRVQVAEALGEHVPRQDLDPVSRGRAMLGPHLDAQTEKALARAEAPEQAMAVLFASPAFQWRV
jgi:uncharacterized protein (DUF1800 family)